MQAGPTVELAARYFDGRSAQARPVTLRHTPQGLHIRGDNLDVTVPLDQVDWPERTRHGKRVAHLAQGGSLQCDDSAAWDAWTRGVLGHSDSAVVRLQQSWRWAAASAVALLVLLAAAYQWGVPLAADYLVAITPPEVETLLGEKALEVVDAQLMQPTTLTPAQQQQITQAMQHMVGKLPPGTVPQWRLAFRKSRIGPNAFALPDGTLVMTDELVRLVDDDEQVVLGVLAHELGHLAHRDGLRMLVQTGALGVLASMVVGDFSTLAATVPALLGQASYSRDAEHAADVMAVQILRQSGISPAVMVTFFDKVSERQRKLQAEREAAGASHGADNLRDSWLGIAIASHPADAERVRFFKEAAKAR